MVLGVYLARCYGALHVRLVPTGAFPVGILLNPLIEINGNELAQISEV
jgi:hypothetical protein